MKQRAILSSVLMVGVLALVSTWTEAPASAGTSSAAVPVTCTFGPNTPIVNTTAHVTVNAPSVALPLLPYSATFLVHLEGLVAPFNVVSFAMTSTYNISGPVTPHGAVVFTEAPQPLSPGQEPSSTTFTKSFTPGLFPGTVIYRFDGVSYDFQFGGSGPIHASCTLDNGPVVINQTQVL